MPAPRRLPPLPTTGNEPFTQEVLDGLGAARHLHLFRTVAHNPGLLRKLVPFAGKLLDGTSLTQRQREIAIVRVGHRAGSRYELDHHRHIAQLAGLSDAEILALQDQADVAWDPLERAIVEAVDQLDAACVVDEATWATLSDALAPKQLVDLVLLIGSYRMLAGFLNTMGIEDDGADEGRWKADRGDGSAPWLP